MARRDKLAARLEGLEAELLERLRPALAQAAHGRNDSIFLCDRVRPAGYPASVRGDIAEAIAALCDDILELRRQLGEPVEHCAAARYLHACHHAYDTSDAHRGGPARIATRLLQEISAD